MRKKTWLHVNLTFGAATLAWLALTIPSAHAASACAGRSGPIFGGKATACFCKTGDSVKEAEDSAKQACLAAPPSPRGAGCQIAASSSDSGWKGWLWLAESAKSFDCHGNWQNQIVSVGPMKSEALLDAAIQRALKKNPVLDEYGSNHPEADKIKFYVTKQFDPGTGAGAATQHEKRARADQDASVKRCIANLKPGDSVAYNDWDGVFVVEVKGILVNIQYGGNNLWVRGTDVCR